MTTDFHGGRWRDPRQRKRQSDGSETASGVGHRSNPRTERRDPWPDGGNGPQFIERHLRRVRCHQRPCVATTMHSSSNVAISEVNPPRRGGCSAHLRRLAKPARDRSHTPESTTALPVELNRHQGSKWHGTYAVQSARVAARLRVRVTSSRRRRCARTDTRGLARDCYGIAQPEI